MAKKKKHIPKWVIPTVISISLAVIFAVAVVIVNIFIPVKYFTAYCVKGAEREAGILRVTFINVEFGDSTLIELPDGKTALIDGGDGSYPHTLSLIKYLNSRGVNTIDYLVCTSVKDEHCGGLAEIVKYKDVKRAFVPYCKNTRITQEYHAFIKSLEDKNVQYTYAAVGEGFYDSSSDYFFTFLSPTDRNSPLSEYAELNKSGNSESIETASVVSWLQFGKVAFAFTSDARSATLKRIVEDYSINSQLGQPFCKIGNYRVKLEDCDIVSVPAHGGEKNTYAPWYDTLKPEASVVSVGKNFANYPSTLALSDACAYTSPLFTSEKGNVVIRATAENYTVV